jgi:hypothetical protein
VLIGDASSRRVALDVPRQAGRALRREQVELEVEASAT